MLEIWEIQRIVTGRPTCFEVSLFCALTQAVKDGRAWRQLQETRLANVLVTLAFIFSSLDETPINHNMSWPLLRAPSQHQDPYNFIHGLQYHSSILVDFY